MQPPEIYAMNHFWAQEWKLVEKTIIDCTFTYINRTQGLRVELTSEKAGVFQPGKGFMFPQSDQISIITKG